jgi:hypothetical protein
MGVERHHENQHGRRGAPPKLTLVGRLETTLDGRPVGLTGDDCNLIIDVGHVRTWLTLRRVWTPLSKHVRPWFARSGMRLMVRTRWFGSVELLPNPPYLVRLALGRC